MTWVTLLFARILVSPGKRSLLSLCISLLMTSTVLFSKENWHENKCVTASSNLEMPL